MTRKANPLVKVLQLLEQLVLATMLHGATIMPQEKLQEKLDNYLEWAEELDSAFPDSASESDLISTTLGDVGFVAADLDHPDGPQPATWAAPPVTKWQQALRCIYGLYLHFGGTRDLLGDGKADKAAGKRPCKEPITPGDQGRDPFTTPGAPSKRVRFEGNAEPEGPSEHTFNATARQAPVPTPGPQRADTSTFDPSAVDTPSLSQSRPSNCGFVDLSAPTPQDLAKDAQINALLQQAMTGGVSGLGAGPSAAASGGSALQTRSLFQLPAVRGRENQNIETVDGKLQLRKKKQLTFEKWLYCNINILLTLSGVEQSAYQDYIDMITTLNKDYTWDAVADFDDDTRERYVRGEIDGFEPQRLLHQFILRYGQQRRSAASANTSRGPANGQKQSAQAQNKPGGKTCNYFNSEAGCTRAVCRFAHKCDKCGSSAHGAKQCNRK